MTKAEEQHKEWVLKHRMGECNHDRCIDAYSDEMALGLPRDPFERQEWYDDQKETFQPWRDGLDQHRWSFQESRCTMCSRETLTVEAGKLKVCIPWCYATRIQFYPTGHLQPYLSDLILHMKNCTSHSSSLTLNHMEYLGNILGSLSLRTSKDWSKSTFSFRNPRPPNKNSSSPTPSQPSDSLTPRPRAFSIPKKSN